MLKIKAPIELKVKTSYVSSSEDFYHRITGNYELLTAGITSEDLLHVVNTPPEIYIAEGEGMTSIINSNRSTELNYQKVDILNNVLNRVMVSAKGELTYQDRVFITDALYKLGIRDDRRFMEQVYEIMNETRNLNKIVDVFVQNFGDVRNFREEINEIANTLNRNEYEAVREENDNRLYESILNRLNTGAVYQIVSNFNTSVDENTFESNEYALSEQTYMALNMLSDRIIGMARGERVPLVYNNENVYEEDIENNLIEESTETNMVTSAVLLDMIRNIYNTGFARFNNTTNQYYSFANTLYRSSDNTLQRLKIETANAINYYNELNEVQNIIENEITEMEPAPLPPSREEEEIALGEEINRINIRNEENRKRYQEYVRNIERRFQRSRPRKSPKDTMRDAARALENPEEVVQQLKEEEGLQDEIRKEIYRETMKFFPENTRKIFEIVEQYYAGDNTNIINGNLSVNNISQLIYDIERVEEDNRRIEELNNIKNESTTQIENVRKLIDTKAPSVPGEAPSADMYSSPASTVHRVNESVSSEEVLEAMENYQRNIRRQMKEEIKDEIVTENRTATNRVVNEINTVQNYDTNLDIQGLIADGVRREIGSISDQVYNRIERQMMNEKSRRGF
ncbi:MAG: hypothetical protein K6F99_04075 [Lachnospiraceae bacterium]|nr:hypothetical protein [Lachnospiraceae bacterium]